MCEAIPDAAFGDWTLQQLIAFVGSRRQYFRCVPTYVAADSNGGWTISGESVTAHEWDECGHRRERVSEPVRGADAERELVACRRYLEREAWNWCKREATEALITCYARAQRLTTPLHATAEPTKLASSTARLADDIVTKALAR